MRKIIGMVIGGSLTAFGFWLAGFDFQHRGGDTLYVYIEILSGMSLGLYLSCMFKWYEE